MTITAWKGKYYPIYQTYTNITTVWNKKNGHFIVVFLHIILLPIGLEVSFFAVVIFFTDQHFFEPFLDESRILQEFQLESDLNSVYESNRPWLISNLVNCEFIWPYCLGLTERYSLDIDIFRPVNFKSWKNSKWWDEIFISLTFPPHVVLILNVKIFLIITKLII